MSEKELKLTDLDYAIASHHLQMLKAALPYMEIPQQRTMSMFIKLSELKRTMDFFNENDEGMMSICSLNTNHVSPSDMLEAIKPYANQKEQEVIDIVSRFMTGRKGREQARSPITPEQLISLLPPEHQSKLETIQLMMQTLSQI